MDVCECQKENVRVILGGEQYTCLIFEKDKHGVKICAYGEGDVEWEPNYCPLCGRKLK